MQLSVFGDTISPIYQGNNWICPEKVVKVTGIRKFLNSSLYVGFPCINVWFIFGWTKVKIEKMEALVQSSHWYQTFDWRSFCASEAKSGYGG